MIQPKKNIPIAPFTHYRIGGVAREVYFPTVASELLEILEAFRRNHIDYYVLGEGSNTLVGDGYWDGAVIIMREMTRCEPSENRVTCGAGMPSSAVAELAHEQAKTGLEFLYLLPGTIGGAIAGNARYDYKNVSDVLIGLVAVHPEKGLRSFTTDEIDFSYKHTGITAEGWLICEVTLAWHPGDPVAIRERMNEIERARRQLHHFDFPSCGCIFKNDYAHNIQAGRLIDSLGLKGLAVGDAHVATFHANFIVNNGHATAHDVLTLIERIEAIVYENKGLRLEREVRLLGNFET